MSYKPLYTLKTTTKPLPSQQAATQNPHSSFNGSHDKNSSALPLAAGGASAPDPSFYRAANEDDDGYDPYSDRQERAPFFEEDPWD